MLDLLVVLAEQMEQTEQIAFLPVLPQLVVAVVRLLHNRLVQPLVGMVVLVVAVNTVGLAARQHQIKVLLVVQVLQELPLQVVVVVLGQ